MSSLKMTFSLASLVLLIALGLIFAPASVMAHPIVTSASGVTPVVYDLTHGNDPTIHAAHPIVKSITLLGDAADGYVNTDSFTIKIEFDSAGATPTNFGASNIDVPSEGGTWVARDILGSGLSYTARILPPSSANADYANQIIQLEGSTAVVGGDVGETEEIYNPPNADGAVTTEADRANPAKAVFNLDISSPVIGTDTDADGVVDTDSTTAQIRAIPPAREPLDDEWSDAFELYFTLEDDDSNDLDSITFAADPAEVKFGEAGGLGGALYGAYGHSEAKYNCRR